MEQDKTEIFDPGQNVLVGQNGKAGGTICHFEGDKMARATSQNGSMGVTILHPDNIRDNKEDNVDNKKDKSVYPSFCSARREGFFGEKGKEEVLSHKQGKGISELGSGLYPFFHTLRNEKGQRTKPLSVINVKKE